MPNSTCSAPRIAREPPASEPDLRLTGSADEEGLEVVAHARERQPGIRTVLLTAYGSPEIERAARERGVDAVLDKPIPLADVASLVFQLLRGDTPGE